MCQVHAAIGPQLTFWWHEKPVPRHIIEDIAAHLEYHQNKTERSRRSHRKRTLRDYHNHGIYLNQTIKCHWPDG